MEVSVLPLVNVSMKRSILTVGVGIESLEVKVGKIVARGYLQGVPALQRRNAIDLPAAEKNVFSPGHVAGKHTPSAER